MAKIVVFFTATFHSRTVAPNSIAFFKVFSLSIKSTSRIGLISRNWNGTRGILIRELFTQKLEIPKTE